MDKPARVHIMLRKQVQADNPGRDGEGVTLPAGMKLPAVPIMDGRQVTGVAVPVPWGYHQLHWMDFQYVIMGNSEK